MLGAHVHHQHSHGINYIRKCGYGCAALKGSGLRKKAISFRIEIGINKGGFRDFERAITHHIKCSRFFESSFTLFSGFFSSSLIKFLAIF
jgi:hypothetical protein